jgi:cell division control protein 42
MENIRDKWYPELRRYSPGVPFILVGTQIDRRPAGNNQSFVSQSEGLKLAKELGAVSHIECSALTREGIREVFVNAILAALDPKKAKASGNSAKSKKCLIL